MVALIHPPKPAPCADLEDIGDLEGYIAATEDVMIFCSKGYFQSKNCMRELRSAVALGKRIFALLEPEPSHGGLSLDEIAAQLLAADAHYDKWGFGGEEPRGAALHEALLASEPIEWNRIGVFQDISMRLIAEAILPLHLHGVTYLQGEISRAAPVRLPPPRRSFAWHVYCSPHVPGGVELIDEVADACQLSVRASTQLDELVHCECMLVFLTGRTWTCGERSAAFAAEVRHAMDSGVRLLLAHEMPGVGGQIDRHGVEFSTFFACDAGATDPALLQRGIYSEIAVPLKGGEWREASMALLAEALAAEPGKRVGDVLAGQMSGQRASQQGTRGSRFTRRTLQDAPVAQGSDLSEISCALPGLARAGSSTAHPDLAAERGELSLAFQRGSVRNAFSNGSRGAAVSEPEPELTGVVSGALDGALQRGSVAQSLQRRSTSLQEQSWRSTSLPRSSVLPPPADRSTALPRPPVLPPPSDRSAALPRPPALPPLSAQVAARVSLCEVSTSSSLSTARSGRQKRAHWGADLPEEKPHDTMTQKKLAARRSVIAARRSHLDAEDSMRGAPQPSSRRFGGGGAATMRSMRQGSVEAPLTSRRLGEGAMTRRGSVEAPQSLRRLGGGAITRRGSVEAPRASGGCYSGESTAAAAPRRLSAHFGGPMPSGGVGRASGWQEPLACAGASSDEQSRTRVVI